MRNKLIQRFTALEQKHLIPDLDRFSEIQLLQCFDQIHPWNVELVREQQASWKARSLPLSFEPTIDCPLAEDQKASPRIKKTATLILAGGQGSRLGIQGPKGCFSILGKSLFDRLLKKMAPSSPVAILTSSLNHVETLFFFREHRSFGMSDLLFFSQETLPLLDETGRWFWEAPGRIAVGADGNGSVFRAFERSGHLQRWIDQEIEAVHIVPVDNPLADPCDPILSSFHAETKADISVKCIRLQNPEEPAGRLVRINERLAIAEFAELSGPQRGQNLYANTGLLAIDISFMRHLAEQTFPLHWAWRSTQSKKFAWKGERFIVDALLYAQNPQAICYPRNACFAPLKDKSSLVEIERLLLGRESRNGVY